MKPEAQRIAIARACGHLNPRQTETGSFVASSAQNSEGKYWGTHGIPDYCNDLNAMHDAEKSLINSTNESLYRNFLVLQCGEWKYHRATAAQRAEDFLRTLNLWTDEA